MESNRQVAITMNHNDEPRNSPPGSRAPRDWAKAAESIPRSTVAGIDNRPAGSGSPGSLLPLVPGAAASVGDMPGSEARVSGETCHGE